MTRDVCKQAHILSECLTYYCDTMVEFDKLATSEKKQVIADLETRGRIHSNGTKSTQSDDELAQSLATNLEDLPGIRANVDVGFEIWGLISSLYLVELMGSKRLRELMTRTEIVRDFAINLEAAKNKICSIYDSSVVTNQKLMTKLD